MFFKKKVLSPKQEWYNLILSSIKKRENITFSWKDRRFYSRQDEYQYLRIENLESDWWGDIVEYTVDVMVFWEKIITLSQTWNNYKYQSITLRKDSFYWKYYVKNTYGFSYEIVLSLLLEIDQKEEQKREEKEKEEEKIRKEDEKYRQLIKKALKIKPLDKDLKDSFDKYSKIIESGKIIERETANIKKWRKEGLSSLSI